ncbi:alkaline phosphatase D [Nocardia transvalensis]|uniref:Alkaline phosphatase D n=1 Tax=Nocardia transvalensis TaxID=37333 RepID=A0A7W9PG41_9NOCA|nr:alkaline phosphatase D family protein [Nocardia transvalensis]MBB5914954.1 alkaline phosphatase D [Nocardia transvalensis]
MPGRVSRRSVLIGAALAGAAACGGPSEPAPRLRYPFTLGVASGEPAATGVVLWTRLAPDPLADDGLGGMPDRVVGVGWEIAADERFGDIVRRGTADAAPEFGHSVHIEADGLRPGAEYFYRFRAGEHLSPVGRTRTAPAAGAGIDALTMCFVSCAQYEHGYFTAYRRLAEDHPDLILHLGDYIYEYGPGGYPLDGGNVRAHVGPEAETLANYRQRYAQYKTDPDLQAAHAVAPWVPVLDDHEVDNNWAGYAYEKPQKPQPNFPARRAAAFRAYYENMPLRRAQLPRGGDLQLFRRLSWGDLATFHMLDTRQYRDAQACGGGTKDCPDRLTPTRTITGGDQERWLLDGFRDSRARWDILGQQVFFSELGTGHGRKNNTDAWDGYAANRDRVVDGWVRARVRNPVVLTGDVHSAWATDIKQRWDDPAAPTVGTELVATSITSGGDGSESTKATPAVLADNPHIKFHNNRRGYVRTRITPDAIHADFRAVPYVSTPGAPAETRASFVIVDRSPGLESA